MAHLSIPEIGKTGQKKIAEAKILVVGAGGLGCPVLQYLAGMGVGVLGLVDSDVVQMSNLHRQILYTEAEIGKRKADVAREKLQLINSTITIEALNETVNQHTVAKCCEHYDLILDCTDNYEARIVLDEYCHTAGKPLVFGAVRQFEGQVTVFNYDKNPFRYCDLFPDEISDTTCSQDGIVGYAAGLVGCLMVNEAVKIILGIGEVLAGSMVTVNVLSGLQRKIILNTGH